MKMQPIPIRLLTSSMTVRTPNGRGFNEPITISHVRFHDVRFMETSEIAVDSDSNSVIYVDATNSEGAFDIPIGSLVSVDGGEERAVIRVTSERAYDQIHHWKLEVR